jgi:hypothetical protein
VSPAGDAFHEMTSRPRFPRAPRRRRAGWLSDADVAALLRGSAHSDRPDLVGLAAFTSEVRALAEQSPAPSPALAALLSQGFGPAAASTEAAAPVSVTPSRPAARGLLVRLAGASLLVKLAAGTGVAVAATAAAASSGVLPEAVQDRVTSVLDAVTPDDSSDPPAVPVVPADSPPTAPRSTPPRAPAEPPAVVPAPRPSAVPSAEAGTRLASPRPTGRAATQPPEQAPSRPAESGRAASVRPSPPAPPTPPAGPPPGTAPRPESSQPPSPTPEAARPTAAETAPAPAGQGAPAPSR